VNTEHHTATDLPDLPTWTLSIIQQLIYQIYPREHWASYNNWSTRFTHVNTEHHPATDLPDLPTWTPSIIQQLIYQIYPREHWASYTTDLTDLPTWTLSIIHNWSNRFTHVSRGVRWFVFGDWVSALLFSVCGTGVRRLTRGLTTLPQQRGALIAQDTVVRPQVSFGWASPWNVILSAFSALTLLVGWQDGHLSCERLGVGLLVVMIWLELCTCYSSSCHHSPRPSSCSYNIQNGDILVSSYLGCAGKWPINECFVCFLFPFIILCWLSPLIHGLSCCKHWHKDSVFVWTCRNV